MLVALVLVLVSCSSDSDRITNGGDDGNAWVTKWESVNLGLGLSSVGKLAVYGEVFADVRSFSTGEYYGLIKWDGVSWESTGFYGVGLLAVIGGKMYVSEDSDPGLNVYDGANWTKLDPESRLGDYMAAVVEWESEVFVGGELRLEGEPFGGIAMWDGVDWYPVGPGIDGTVRALVSTPSALYAAGRFDSIGVIAAPGKLGEVGNIAKWDGVQWAALGAGLRAGSEEGEVTAMVADGADLYVAGAFSMAGATPANNIARWDGTQWHTLGNGLNDVVLALSFVEGNLVAAGMFSRSDEVELNSIGLWDGGQWLGMGGGLSRAGGLTTTATSLFALEDTVYVGGNFTHADQQPSAGLARIVFLKP
jgi:hypothetical protein